MGMSKKRAWCFRITGLFLNIAVLGLAGYGLYDIIVAYTGTKSFGVGTSCVSQCGTSIPFQSACTSNSSTGINATTSFIIERDVVISTLNINAKTVLIVIFVVQLAFALISFVLIIMLKYQLYKNEEKSWRNHVVIAFLALCDIVLAIAGIGLVIIPIVYLAKFGSNSISFHNIGALYLQNQCDTAISFDKAKAESNHPPGTLCSTFNISAYSYFSGNSPSNQSEYITLSYTYSGDDPICRTAAVATQCFGNSCISTFVVGGEIAKQDVYGTFHENLIRAVAISVSAMAVGVVALILELADGW